MRPILKTELRELAAHGQGVVLVDRRSASDERTSTLHHVSCPWPWKTGMGTPLLYAPTIGAALKWLHTHRGEEGDRWKRCRDCRAAGRPATDGEGFAEPTAPGAVRRSPRVVGQPIWLTDRGRDLGWVTGVSEDAIEVAEFDSAGAPATRGRRTPHAATSPFLPRTGDRCFIEIHGEWQAGTCLEDVADPDALVTIDVDGETLDVPLSDVKLRPLRATDSPLTTLARSEAGSVSQYRARARFMKDYWSIAEASRGLLGVSSSAADLHPHQVGVARRVLADPVQRYLLADEVGLGKTIEAGFVIRQRLIDAPSSVVVVLVPEALVWQWEAELDTKFGIRDLRRGGIEVVSFDAPRAFDRVQVPDLLVIDEAHRVAAGWNSTAKELAERFEAARLLAHRVPRILLLSATPVLHREADLLAMLHLLDPDTYRLEDLDAFKARVADRERIGEMLLALRPGAPGFLLRARLPDIGAAFPEDDRLAHLLEVLGSNLDGDDSAREEALSDARAHLSETYRLHRRLLRNRRVAIEATTYAVRGRSGVSVVGDRDARRSAVDHWLERWRLTLLEDAREMDDAAASERAGEAFLVYLQCSTGDLESLRAAVQFKRTWKRALRDAAGMTPEDAALVRGFPISERQRAVLAELDEILGEPTEGLSARGAEIATVLLALDEEAVVVFVTSRSTAAAVGNQLELAGEAVGLYAAGRSDAERRTAAVAFMEGTGRRFLICDRTGEEGVNLQVADCIVHADLPLSTTRIEQRIGRVDRHGPPRPVRNYVLSPGPETGAADWWLGVLRDGFEVFERTTAPIQHAIESVERGLLLTLASEGTDEAARVAASLHERVAEEQARIDKLDSLDALARQDSDDVQFVDAVREVENAGADGFSTGFLAALDAASVDLGAVTAAREGGGSVVRLSKSPPALRVYAGVADRELVAAADRKLAVMDSAVSLLRPGAPLVEAVRLHLDWDDRGQTATVWGRDASLAQSMFAVRCDVIVRADPSRALAVWNKLEMARPRTSGAVRTDADAPLAIGALQRRVDAYLPPSARTVWVDQHGSPIVDATLVHTLEFAVSDAGDQQWSERQWKLVARHCGVLSVDDVLLSIANAVQEEVVGSSPIQEAARQASARARTDWSDATRTLRLRAEMDLSSAAAARDLVAEQAVAEVLLEALASPVAQWSGAAVVFLEAEEER